ncbi:MAG: glutathione transferase GstA [Rhodocyclaceae bacterium]|nr:glutathione transferase GstA [Rhodocyclaceae bacterium]
MKLYYSPGACSLSPHIVLREAGLAFELEKVNLKTKQTETGADFRAVNPKGYVPALRLDDGSVLTEGPAVVQYIADLAPERGLAPAAGTLARYRLMEWLNFISTELHKAFGALFNPLTPEDWKTFVRGLIGQRLDYIAGQLGERPYLMGETFTVPDAYLFTILRWGKWTDIDIGRWPVLKTYVERIAARPAVHAALAAERLLQEQEK